MRKTLVCSLALLALGCGIPSFDPPLLPKHTVDDEDGAWHPAHKEQPFLCAGVPCETLQLPGRPPDAQLSCDAAGCHGTYNYGVAGLPALDTRELRGSDGPSCYTCHGKKWDGGPP